MKYKNQILVFSLALFLGIVFNLKTNVAQAQYVTEDLGCWFGISITGNPSKLDIYLGLRYFNPDEVFNAFPVTLTVTDPTTNSQNSVVIDRDSFVSLVGEFCTWDGISQEERCAGHTVVELNNFNLSNYSTMTLVAASMSFNNNLCPIQNNGFLYTNSLSEYPQCDQNVVSNYGCTDAFDHTENLVGGNICINNHNEIIKCCPANQDLRRLATRGQSRCSGVYNLPICPGSALGCRPVDDAPGTSVDNSTQCYDETNNRLMYCCTGGQFLNRARTACLSLGQDDFSNPPGQETIASPSPTVFTDNSYSLDDFDPLLNNKNKSIATSLTTPAGIINRFLVFAFPLAGLILFVMIVWGGFDMLSKAATKKSMDDGKKRITNAIIGFMLLFAAYWMTQIIEVIFGIKVL